MSRSSRRAELHILGRESLAENAVRNYFLQLIQKTAPEVISDLQQNALPHYSAMSDAQRALIGSSGFFDPPFDPLRLVTQDCAPCARLIEALEGWRTRWRLKAHWIERAVERALELWHGVPKVVEGAWPPGATLVSSVEQPRVVEGPSLPPYNPLSERRSDYRKRARLALEAYMDDVEEETRVLFSVADWPKKLSQGGRKRDQHFRWCLRYLLGETQHELSFRPTGSEPPAPPRNALEKSVVDEGTIRRGIHEAAKYLGLTLP